MLVFSVSMLKVKRKEEQNVETLLNRNCIFCKGMPAALWKKGGFSKQQEALIKEEALSFLFFWAFNLCVMKHVWLGTVGSLLGKLWIALGFIYWYKNGYY